MNNELSSHVDVKYEAWANREQVIGEHLRSLYEAQSALSEIVSGERLTCKQNVQIEAWWEFYKKASKLFQQARPKILKMKGLDDKTKESKKKSKFILDYQIMLDAVSKASNYMFTGDGEALSIKEYRDTIELISLLYDKLGYSAAERKVTRTGFLSDIQVPTEDGEGEEMESME
jgi:hypothetical protein